MSRVRTVAFDSRLALAEVKIETGRTHQIRVHLAHCNHPILGDDVYGSATKGAIHIVTVPNLLTSNQKQGCHSRANPVKFGHIQLNVSSGKRSNTAQFSNLGERGSMAFD